MVQAMNSLATLTNVDLGPIISIHLALITVA